MTSPRYCGQCGAIAGRSPVCHVCGAELDEDGQVRTARGRSKAAARTQTAGTPASAAQGSAPPLLLFIVLAAIVAIAFAAYVLLARDNGDKASAGPNAVARTVGGVLQVAIPRTWTVSETAKGLTLAANASDLNLAHPELGPRINIQVVDAGASRDPESFLRGSIPASDLNVVLLQPQRATYGKDAKLAALDATIGHTFEAKPYVARYVVAYDPDHTQTPVMFTLEMPARLYAETQPDAKRIADEAQAAGKPIDDKVMPDNPSLVLLRILGSASVLKR